MFRYAFEAGALVAGSHDEVMAHMREKHPEKTSAAQDQIEESHHRWSAPTTDYFPHISEEAKRAGALR